ncbi:restriction endonuclease [Bilophila wadsworthia]|uniref:restriction endonuclease n=1 Tax=Bilophila wadsworthia TaxID=35833 RepID=UPI0032200234
MKGIIVFLYFLIIPIFIVLFYRSKKLDNEKDKLNIDRENLYNRIIEMNKKEAKIEELKQELIIKEKIINEKTSSFPWIGEYYSKIASQKASAMESYLRYKANPALHSAEIVRILKNDISKLSNLIIQKDGIIAKNKFDIEKRVNLLLEEKKKELEREKAYIFAREEDTEKKRIALKKEFEEFEKTKQIQEKLFKEKTQGFPWIAQYYASFIKELGDIVSIQLEQKKNPALVAAEKVKEFSRRTAIAEKQNKIYKGIIKYYEYLFPWLADFKDAPDEKITCNPQSDKEYKDEAQRFLSSSEWGSLNNTEKYQISLDRYWEKHKTNWEIGRDYERFIGYLYETQGYDVTYFGALKGFEDMGRDLIVKKDKATKIVQCKYWSKEKTIHEKHIFQLFGTCITYSLSEKKKCNQNSLIEQKINVTGVFVTSCHLSDTAHEVAKMLNIEIIENKKFQIFPCIKCNIGATGERIYHLPFDQCYDKVKIETAKGELYCNTIKEAEAAGFRRAYRWRGNTS